MRKIEFMLLAVAVITGSVVMAVVGCGGGDEAGMYFSISERASWAPDGNLAFAAFGGNAMLYVYKVNEKGQRVVLLTQSDNDEDFDDEGGWHPAYSPDGSLIAFASRRGPSPAIWTMDGDLGDRQQVQRITDDSDLGSDEQPSWRPDGNVIIFTSTRNNGNHDICVINSDGTGRVDLLATGAEEQWPMYNPQNADQIALQISDHDSHPDAAIAALWDNDNDTDICIYDTGTSSYNALAAANSPYRDEAPAWSPDGTKIAFHSNRSGDFDIWVVEIATGTLTHITNDARSDGFPIWNEDGSRIAFIRDRELWTVAADGTDPERVTRRF